MALSAFLFVLPCAAQRYATGGPDILKDFELDDAHYPFQKFPSSYVDTALSEGVDWTLDARGVVTPAKDQAQHGYCGTFARVAAAEGQYALKSGHPARNFSVEQMVDCVGAYKAQRDCIAGACSDYPGFMTEEDYPYDSSNYKEFDPPSKTHPCKYDASKVVPDYINKVTGTTSVSGQTEDQAAAFIHHNGPITCGINSEVLYKADHSDWFIDEKACNKVDKDIDHSVTCVGFGVDPKKGPYWKIKNSWANDWADEGFVRIARGVKCAGLGTSFGWLPVYGDVNDYYVTSDEVTV